jgi:uncharacterized protein
VRVVLDSSVIVAAVLSPQGPSGQVVELALRGEVEVVGSRQLMAAAAVAQVVSAEAGEMVAAVLADLSQMVQVGSVPEVARDRDDDMVVAVALAGRAEYVVTHDHDLLALNRRDLGISFIEPARLLEVVAFLGGGGEGPGDA